MSITRTRNERAERIPLAPLQTWLEQRVIELAREHDSPAQILACRLMPTRPDGAALRELNRWRRGVRAGSLNGRKGEIHTDVIRRDIVEDALHYAGIPLCEIYPDLADDDVEVEPAARCPRCRDTVTPINGACPWCDTPTSAPSLEAAA